jgi:hypothetical protein
MKKVLSGLMILVCGTITMAGNGAAFPKENVAVFVAEKLDVTTLPAAIRPKREKNRKTFGEYGYVMSQTNGETGLVEEMPGGPQISLRILEQNNSGMYVCVKRAGSGSEDPRVQRVVYLKLKDAGTRLKGSESFKEFEGCPVIGADPDDGPSSYGG